MPEETETENQQRIAARIEEDLAANYRLRVTARGLARSNMLKDGILPDYAPVELTQNLDEQLSALGFGLLQSAIEAKESQAGS